MNAVAGDKGHLTLHEGGPGADYSKIKLYECSLRPGSERKMSFRKLENPDHHPKKVTGDTAYWVIGTKSETGQVSTACKRFCQAPFEKLTIPNDTGLRKVQWRQNNLVIHLSRFEFTPQNPETLVKRHPVELIVNKGAVISVDHGDDDSQLVKVSTQVLEGDPLMTNRPALSVVDKIISENLHQADLLVDKFNIGYLRGWEKAAAQNRLDDKICHTEVPRLQNTLLYVKRKLQQFQPSFGALARGFSNGNNPNALFESEQALHAVISKIDDLVIRSNALEERQDRRRGEKLAELVLWLTYPISLSAPPIVADLFNKIILTDEHHLHKPIFLASLVVGFVCAVGFHLKHWGPSLLHTKKARSASPT